MRILVAGSITTFLAISLACSGDSSSSSTSSSRFGEATLAGGFTPDPHTASVIAGGSTSTTDAGWPSSCVGYVETGAPDYVLDLSTMPLARVAACATDDTSLAIKGPDGTWYCDDDTEGTNPVVDLNSPSGTYEVWVGTYSNTTPVSSTLYVTESSGTVCPAPSVDMSGTPVSGTTSLASGFGSEGATVTAGGDTDVDSVPDIPGFCTGNVTESGPTYRVEVAAGASPMRVAACATADTTLLINDGDGEWHCNDDGEEANPVVSLSAPVAGTYDIWVGTYGGGTSSAELKFTETMSGNMCN